MIIGKVMCLYMLYFVRRLAGASFWLDREKEITSSCKNDESGYYY